MSNARRRTRRCGNGEGSIFQRKDGRWVTSLTVGYDVNGGRQRKDVYGKTKKEVQGKLTEMQQSKKVGTMSSRTTIKVCELLDRWLYDAARLTVRDSTFRRYSELLRIHVKPRIGGIKLSRLKASDVQSIFSTMEHKGRSIRTRQFVYDVLNMALTRGTKWGLLENNVCEQLTRPKVPKQQLDILNSQQASVFLKAAASDRLSALYVLAITVGMRQGELFALQWSDVNLDAGQLSVRHTLDGGKLSPPPQNL